MEEYSFKANIRFMAQDKQDAVNQVRLFLINPSSKEFEGKMAIQPAQIEFDFTGGVDGPVYDC